MTTRTSRPISGSAEAGPASTDIVDRLRQYNPPDRTIDAQRQMSMDIHEAADIIQALHVELDELKADIANALTDLTDCSIENDALRARVAELGSADTCGRVCEGTAYRLEARSLRAKVDELQADNTSLLALVADIRCALGDNGKRMQTELIEWCAELVKTLTG